MLETFDRREAAAAAERAARAAYGRLLAYLTSQWKDVAASEDALGDAFAQALERWPLQGVPERPEAWLLTVARRRLIDAQRRNKYLEPVDLNKLEAQADAIVGAKGIPDKRLALMLLCAHPAIDPGVRTALMLQTVLGIEVRVMSSAYLTSPDTLTKRLSRAKRKIRDAGLTFELPQTHDLAERLHHVLEAIYAAYFLGADATQIMGDISDNLSQEAIYLADLVAALEPDSAEALGLLSLLLFCESRRAAQVSSTDEFIELEQQNPDLWDRERIDAAHRLLARAASLKYPGPFQTEAAIQAAHCYRLHSGKTPWKEIARLYDTLMGQSSTVAGHVGRAVAYAFAAADGALGLRLLGEMDTAAKSYLPWWLAQAHFQHMLADSTNAIQSLRRAIGLSSQPRMKRTLLKKLADWQNDGTSVPKHDANVQSS